MVISATDPGVATPGLDLWFDPDAVGGDIPFPQTYGEEKNWEYSTIGPGVLYADVNGVWTPVAQTGPTTPFPSTYDELAAAAAAP